MPHDIKSFLDAKVQQYNRPDFIENDPISIPHEYRLKQDIEIAGFFAAILAWGQRKTIINKCRDLLNRMDNQPYQFMRHHTDADLKGLLGFKHRTFNDTDLLYFVSFFKQHYAQSASLESAFTRGQAFNADYMGDVEPAAANRASANRALSDPASANPTPSSPVCLAGEVQPFSMERALNSFRAYFFSLEDFPSRTIKHISSPLQKSTCKRLNMFLRWMVRKDHAGVDFGLWNQIPMHALICPCDVHVDRVGRKLGLIHRQQTDWQTALQLTTNLRIFDPKDPVKYDFALFGMGVEEKYGQL